jgi:type IV secretory pathway VirJ component
MRVDMPKTLALLALLLLPAPRLQELKDLPLFEVPAGKPGDTLAVFLSGDGGWARLDRSVAAELAGQGVAVVGLSSRKYFWHARTPEHAAADLARILRAYLAAWKKDKVILAGYSFGADALPALASRLPADLQERVGLVALIAASRTATFEIHVAEWLRIGADKGEPVLAEARKLQGKRLVCIYGEEERSDSSCPEIGKLPNARAVALPGGHHFKGRYDLLAGEILNHPATAPPAPPPPPAPAAGTPAALPRSVCATAAGNTPALPARSGSGARRRAGRRSRRAARG